MPGAPEAAALPRLAFRVERASVVQFAAVPTLGFTVRAEADGGVPIRSVALDSQIRIAAARRLYDAAARERLAELFGAPSQWGTTLRSLLWTHASVQIPPFTGSTLVELPVACTYDFEVAAVKYFAALEDGEIPLEFLFSGTVFFAGEGGALRTIRISWEAESEFRMPVALWREMMAQYFPNTAWLRLRKDTFDRLQAFRARRALPTWEAAVDALLDEGRRDDGAREPED